MRRAREGQRETKRTAAQAILGAAMALGLCACSEDIPPEHAEVEAPTETGGDAPPAEAVRHPTQVGMAVAAGTAESLGRRMTFRVTAPVTVGPRTDGTHAIGPPAAISPAGPNQEGD